MLSRPYAALSVLVALSLTGCLPLWTTPAQLSVDAAIIAAEERKIGDVAEDFALKASILKEFTLSGLVWVRADVYQGDVLLTGAVKTDEDQKRAVELTTGVEGVKKVYDEIQVLEDATIRDTAQDLTTEYKIQGALLNRIKHRIINYRWRCVNGIAYLIGLAGDQEELDEAVDAILGADGVEDVVNHVRLKPVEKDKLN